MTIGNRLKTLRTSAKMSQDKLGELLFSQDRPDGVTKQAVAAWEKDRNQLNADQVVRICEIFNANLNWLLTGKGERQVNSVMRSVPDDMPNNLDYITDREKMLITIFRETDNDGRDFLESQASAISRKRLDGTK